MAKTYRSSRGEMIDIDMLRLANETTIAVGNMRTNARGDQLGPGGKIVKTRAQLMQEYHKLNTPVADDTPIAASVPKEQIYDQKPTHTATPVAEDIPVAKTNTVPDYVKPRGSLANAVAEETEVKQELLDPAPSRSDGVQRI